MPKLGLGLIALAVVMAVLAIWQTVAANAFAAAAAKAEGEVIELRLEQSTTGTGASRRSQTMAQPVVRFAVDGTTHTFVHPVSSSPPAYAVGEKVPVLYQPDDPNDAMIDSFMAHYLLPLAFGMFGAIALVIGVVLLLAGRRR